MPATLPDSAKLRVPPNLAGQLRDAAERLPEYANQDYYDLQLQAHVSEQIRESCPDGFDWLVDQIRTRLAQRPYCALVAGLLFDEGNRLFVGINRAFGDLVARPYEKPRAQLVHYIQPATDLPATRGGQYESEKLHTDTADWEPIVELISMVCVRADKRGGGRSKVLDVDALREEVRERLGPATLELLASEPVPWQLAPYRGGGQQWRAVLTDSCICWRRYTIDAALASLGSQLSEPMTAALDALEALLAATPRTIEFLMDDGEILFLDNKRTIHARTPIENAADSDRLMIRSWIQAAKNA